MKKNKAISLLLAGLLSISMSTTIFATDYDAEIEYAQAARQQAEAQLSQTQSAIGSLEAKRQELEGYLAQLNAQYEELTNSIASLGIEAAEKEEALKVIKENLDKARATADQQYEAMKIRIVYMYEKGGASALEMMLSADSFAEFLNRAENIAQISEYDRNMLSKYEKLQKDIQEQEEALEREAAEIEALMQERSAKKQEVQNMAAGTSADIQSYVAQISATQEEASALMAEVANADSAIYNLMQAQEAAEAAAAAEAAQQEEASYEETAEEAVSNEAYEEPAEETYEEPVEETYEEPAEETYQEIEDYQEPEVQEESSSSGSGTYLGNFTLTAYCNCAQCCGTAGNLTASGTVPAAGRTVAMAGVPFGTQLMINGNVYTVEDLGTPYGHVDIFFNSHSDALAFGLQHADVYQVG